MGWPAVVETLMLTDLNVSSEASQHSLKSTFEFLRQLWSKTCRRCAAFAAGHEGLVTGSPQEHYRDRESVA